jgi:hypothetical protein
MAPGQPPSAALVPQLSQLPHFHQCPAAADLQCYWAGCLCQLWMMQQCPHHQQQQSPHCRAVCSAAPSCSPSTSCCKHCAGSCSGQHPTHAAPAATPAPVFIRHAAVLADLAANTGEDDQEEAEVGHSSSCCRAWQQLQQPPTAAAGSSSNPHCGQGAGSCSFSPPNQTALSK